MLALTRAALPLGLCVMAACAARGQGSGTPAGGMAPQRGDTTVEGTVTSVGADPFAQIVLATASGDVGVQGALAGEIAALQGAVVRIWGPAAANQPPVPTRAVDVRGYDVVSVGGEPVYVGELVRRGEEVWLVGRDRMQLAAVPTALASRVGAKVWLGGMRRGNTFEIRLFGIIREASTR